MCLLAQYVGIFVYVGLSVLRDFKANRLEKKQVSENELAALRNQSVQRVILDAEKIETEKNLSSEKRQDIPIQVSSASKIFEDTTRRRFLALDGVSVNLLKGETLGLLGPNGAGKSTLFNIMSTYHSLSQGEIKIFGKELEVKSSFFKETGICPQDEIVWDSLSVDTHLKMICIIKGIDYEYLKVWLKLMDMDRFTGNCPAELSSGMKRKL